MPKTEAPRARTANRALISRLLAVKAHASALRKSRVNRFAVLRFAPALRVIPGDSPNVPPPPKPLRAPEPTRGRDYDRTDDFGPSR